MERPPDDDEGLDTFELWAENKSTYSLFDMCSTQWRIVAGPSGAFYQGLDYPSLFSVMRMMDVNDKKSTLENIRLIEIGALGELNKKG